MKERIRRKISWKQHLLWLLLIASTACAGYGITIYRTKQKLKVNVSYYEQLEHNEEMMSRSIYKKIRILKYFINRNYTDFRPLANCLESNLKILGLYSEMKDKVLGGLKEELYKIEGEDYLKKAHKIKQETLMRLGNQPITIDVDALIEKEAKLKDDFLFFTSFFNHPDFQFKQVKVAELFEFKSQVNHLFNEDPLYKKREIQVIELLTQLSNRINKIYSLYQAAFALIEKVGLPDYQQSLKYALINSTIEQDFNQNQPALIKFRLQEVYDLSWGNVDCVLNGDTVGVKNGHLAVPVFPQKEGENEQEVQMYLHNTLTGKTETFPHTISYKAISKN